MWFNINMFQIFCPGSFVRLALSPPIDVAAAVCTGTAAQPWSTKEEEEGDVGSRMCA